MHRPKPAPPGPPQPAHVRVNGLHVQVMVIITNKQPTHNQAVTCTAACEELTKKLDKLLCE